MPIQDDFGQIY